jgi:NAD(P)-dependent dehydrogenase (short-subunit alcohol dehydrogenase family)
MPCIRIAPHHIHALPAGARGDTGVRNLNTLFDLTGRTAIVTGASAGLGVTFAEALASNGANVVLAARRLERLQEVAATLTATGATVLPITCDVSDATQVQAMVARAAERFGRIDILVNNAGIVADIGPVPERLPHELFLQTVQVNLFGVWYCCREVGARMLSDGKGGSIINVSSILGLGGQQNFPPAYQATKAAVINLGRALACSWADRGVRVNALAPGYFPSEMTDAFFASPAFLEHVQAQAPMGRVGRPDELAGALLFLASDASSFVTGQTIVVDGGFSASLGTLPLTDELLGLFEAVTPNGLGKRIMPQ